MALDTLVWNKYGKHWPQPTGTIQFPLQCKMFLRLSACQLCSLPPHAGGIGQCANNMVSNERIKGLYPKS